ncbi:MAG: DNA-processing protein DprA [Burkholderiales bacterium]|nr:DNA-processing protein DprA [Burkholderiales bacterium]
MKSDSDVAAWVALGSIPGLGGEFFRKLLAVFGDPQRVLNAGKGDLEKVVNRSLAAKILLGPDERIVEIALKWLADPANGIVTLADSEYPRPLLNIPDPPPLLYLKGKRALLGKRSFAIVGSRNATPQGVENAQSFARVLSDSGLCIISGLALGIDAAAHKGALAGASSSMAVVGTGLDVVYPARNRDLARELETKGLLVSEFPLGTPPLGTNFPRRNRIISGLSLGCLIVEAGIRSGSLITARHAAEQGRDVFAIPGSIHSPLSKGPHRLIKEGAKLVESAQDILEELGLPAVVSFDDPGIDSDPAKLLEQMGFDLIDLDTLCLRTGWTPQIISARLLDLEIAGFIKGVDGGMYQRVH